MRNFTTEDFSGAGQYLVRISPLELSLREKGEFKNYTDTGFLSTIMYKVGWIVDSCNIGNGEQIYALIAMSDGMIIFSNYTSRPAAVDNYNKVIWQRDDENDVDGGKRKLVEWLNNEKLSAEYRFATQEEVVRVVMYQSSRWR